MSPEDYQPPVCRMCGFDLEPWPRFSGRVVWCCPDCEAERYARLEADALGVEQ